MKSFLPVRIFIPAILITGIYLLLSCGTRAVEPVKYVPNTASEVPADGILEAVTWNLQWYGDDTYGQGQNNGPENEQLQARNIVTVLDSLDADLYAFQEVYNTRALQSISDYLPGYRGFVADHISWIQKTAFVYNTRAIDSVSAGAISEGMNKEDWADGRYPLYFKFNYTWQGRSHPVMAIVIHAKAFDDRTSYFKRKRAARQLYTFLQSNESSTQILLMGDFNDDVDQSIYSGAPTPYLAFASDSVHYEVVTQPLSRAGKSSTLTFNDVIDHIVISNELFDEFIDNSESIYDRPLSFIDQYAYTTSDHLPVWAKFSFIK